jgi:PAS domain S-box-containing protein
LPDLNWTVVAQIESEEAFAPVAALRWRILWPALLVAVLMFVAARVLASRVTKPVLTLAEGARMLGQRHFGVRLPVASEDEIGQLALSFNRMAEDLENTTVSRRELDRILNSLLNAVFVIDAASAATVHDVLDAPVRRANRAALDLLGYLLNDLEKVPFRSILVGAEDEWEHRVRRILDEGRLPALEAALADKHGTSVPVLLAASWLADEPGRQPGIVFIAQDIAEWKLTQDKLRRMSKVFMDATDPIVVTASDGRISDCNAEAERVYGWSRGELDGTRITVLFPTGKRAELSDLLRRCLRGEPIRNVETVQVDRRGREIPALVTLSLLTGQGGEVAGVAAITKDITERKQAEQTLRQKQQELEALTARLLTAQEEERSRLARELHDDLTQRLAAVAIEVGRLERIAHEDTHLWASRVEKIKQQMADLSKDVHGMSRRLHPSTLDDLGLVAAIESECRAFFERGGPPVELSADETLDALPRPVQSALYRIVQESLRNILKHSDADEVRIELRRTAEDAQLRIFDNGQGFDRTSADSRGGIGLASMEERARLIGGRFLIRSSAGAGTEVLVTVPSGMGNEEAESTAG